MRLDQLDPIEILRRAIRGSRSLRILGFIEVFLLIGLLMLAFNGKASWRVATLIGMLNFSVWIFGAYATASARPFPGRPDGPVHETAFRLAALLAPICIGIVEIFTVLILLRLSR